MSKPTLLSFRVLFECSECGRKQTVDADVGIAFVWPEQRYAIDYIDMINLASEHDYLVGDNGNMICFECSHKKHVDASLPTIAEHNPSLKGCV